MMSVIRTRPGKVLRHSALIAAAILSLFICITAFFSGKGAYFGITAEYLSLIQKRTGLRFQVLRLRNREEIFNAIREGLRSLLEKEERISVLALADNGKMAVRLAKETLPDVVVMDIAMPDMNGIEVTRRLVSENPEIKVLALSMHSARRFLVEALSAGARGYLLKDCAVEELVRAIRTVAAGKVYLSPDVADQIVKDFLKNPPETSPSTLKLLSARENEVLQLISEGKNTKEIAFTLHVSIKTVESHRQQIMKKLNLQSVAGLTRYAIREGLTPPGIAPVNLYCYSGIPTPSFR